MFKLHARKNTVVLSAKTAMEASEWISALQDAINTCPTIQTITERVILEIIVRRRNRCNHHLIVARVLSILSRWQLL